MKHALIVLVSVVGLFAALYLGAKVLDPGYDKERAEILRVAYSHSEITTRVGSVRTASFTTQKKEGLAVLSRIFRDDWTRARSQGATKGSARLFIIGSKEGGFFVIHYTYTEKDGQFTLDSVDTSAFDSPQERRSSRHRQLRGAGAPLRVRAQTLAKEKMHVVERTKSRPTDESP